MAVQVLPREEARATSHEQQILVRDSWWNELKHHLDMEQSTPFVQASYGPAAQPPRGK